MARAPGRPPSRASHPPAPLSLPLCRPPLHPRSRSSGGGVAEAPGGQGKHSGADPGREEEELAAAYQAFLDRDVRC